MPLSLTIEVASVLEKRGFITAPSVSIVASTVNPMTLEGVRAEDDFDLLARLQGILIHVPPGPCPLWTSARAPTKTQIMAKQKAEKDAKAKAAEKKRLLVASRRFKANAKQQEVKTKHQEKLILTAEAKAAKVVAKTDELCLKLEEAIKASTVVLAKIPSPLSDTVHSHKKSKRSLAVPLLA